MQCCDDSSFLTPCREVFCIHSPGEQILNAWSDEDRCKRIGGLFGTKLSGGVNKKACCDATCGACGGANCGKNPETGNPDPVRASKCCLDQIIDKTTRNETTGVVTTYANKACGAPPCVLGTDLVFPVGQVELDGIASHIVNYAGNTCHLTSRTHLRKILGNLKLNEIEAASGYSVTAIQRHGDALYIVANMVSELGSSSLTGSPVAKVYKKHYLTGADMWPGPVNLNRHVVGSPVRFTSVGEFSQRQPEITAAEGRLQGAWRGVNGAAGGVGGRPAGPLADGLSDENIYYVWNPTNAYLNAGQDQAAFQSDSNDAEITFQLKCTTAATVGIIGHAKRMGGAGDTDVTFEVVGSGVAAAAFTIAPAGTGWEWTSAAQDTAIPNEGTYTVKLSKPEPGVAIRALKIVQGSDVCYWLPGESNDFMFLAFQDGFVAKYTDPDYNSDLAVQEAPQLKWEEHVTGPAEASVLVVGAPSVERPPNEICANELGYDCSTWELAPGTNESVRTGQQCTPEAASKCCICGRGAYLAIHTLNYVALMDAGDGSALLGTMQSFPSMAPLTANAPGQYFKVARGTYSQVKQRCEDEGGSLAIIQDAYENAMAQAACKYMNVGESRCFIGFHRPVQVPSGPVTRYPHGWITGEEPLFVHWKSGNLANKPAAVIKISDGTWDTAADDEEHAGVCSYVQASQATMTDLKTNWYPALYGGTFQVDWKPKENETTYFYKASFTEGAHIASHSNIGPFVVPGPYMVKMSKGVTMSAQRGMHFVTDQCVKLSSEGKIVDDADCCERASVWVGCKAGYEHIPSTDLDTAPGCNAPNNNANHGPQRKIKCKRASYAEVVDSFKLPDTPRGPFKWKLSGRFDKVYTLEAKSVDGSAMLHVKITGPPTNGITRKVQMRQVIKPEKGAHGSFNADSFGNFKQACANLGGILSVPATGSGSPPRAFPCCPAACGQCGGVGCSSRTGGANQCCGQQVITANLECGNNQAPPCVFKKNTNDDQHMTSPPTEFSWSASAPPGVDLRTDSMSIVDDSYFEWELRLVHRPAPNQTYTCLALNDLPAAGRVSGLGDKRERCESMNHLDKQYHYKYNGDNGGLVENCASWCVRGNTPAAWYWELHWDGAKQMEVVADKLFDLKDFKEVVFDGLDHTPTVQQITEGLADSKAFAHVLLDGDYRIIYGSTAVAMVLDENNTLTEVWKVPHDNTAFATTPVTTLWSSGTRIYYGYGTMLYAREKLTGALVWKQELNARINAPVLYTGPDNSGPGEDLYVTTSDPAVLYRFGAHATSNATHVTYPLGPGSSHASPVLSAR